MCQSVGIARRAGVAAAEDQRDRGIECRGAACRCSAPARFGQAAAASAAHRRRLPSRVAGCALRAHRRARCIHSSMPAVPRAARRHRRRLRATAGNMASANSAATGLKLNMEILLLKLTNTRRESAGVDLLVNQRRRVERGSGTPRRRDAERCRPRRGRARDRGKRWIAQHHGGRAAHHVLQRRERGALAAELRLRGRGVRIGFEVRAGVHHHAELGEQQRQRQHMHEPAAIASNQKSLRGRVFRASGARLPTSSALRRKLTARRFDGVSDVGVSPQ